MQRRLMPPRAAAVRAMVTGNPAPGRPEDLAVRRARVALRERAAVPADPAVPWADCRDRATGEACPEALAPAGGAAVLLTSRPTSAMAMTMTSSRASCARRR